MERMGTARIDSTVWPLLDYCIGRPAVTAPAVAADLGVSDVAAQNALIGSPGWGSSARTQRPSETGSGLSPMFWTQSTSSWNERVADESCSGGIAFFAPE